MVGFAKGQFAMEYLLIIGFSIVLLLPLISLIYGEFADIQEEINEFELNEAMNELIFQIERINEAGVNSKNTVLISFPSGLDNITTSNTQLMANYQGGESYKVFDSRANMSGELQDVGGRTTIVLDVVLSNQNQVVVLSQK